MGEFIDIHTHIAWDIDDGMPCKEDAVSALQAMKQDGINAVIATPHHVPGQMDKESFKEVASRIEELKQLALEFGIEVQYGSEIFLNYNYLDLLDQSLYFPLAGSEYVLVEFDVRKNIAENDEAEDMLYEITIRDRVPVIAHAERYFHEGVDLKRVQQWIDMGCVIQMNRTSLLGMHGATTKKNAEKLLDHGLVHLMASDAHRATGNRVGKLSDVYAELVQSYGKKNADLLCKINPAHILQNEELEAMIVEKPSKFKRLWRR